MRNQIQKVLEGTRNEQMRVVKLREQVQAEIGNLKKTKALLWFYLVFALLRNRIESG